MVMLQPFVLAFSMILGMSLAFLIAIAVFVLMYHMYEIVLDKVHEWRYREYEDIDDVCEDYTAKKIVKEQLD